VDLKNVSSHFQFGKNWKSFVNVVDDERIFRAMKGLEKLIPNNSDINGKKFFDIGCGSGLSMLAALRLGASEASGVDIDPHSVDAAQALLSQFAPKKRWRVYQRSVFEVNSEDIGNFDVVHSWGVLHHTGNMWEAIAKAASLVKKDGLLVIAIYHRTPWCHFWRVEKKLYVHANVFVRCIIRLFYKTAFMARQITLGRNPWRFISDYHRSRGMNWHHDVHDWLGGYPYESALPDEVSSILKGIGLVLEKVFENCAEGKGVFGTACDEFVARRK
jgi:2-polyprenyl-3-methyl-5-hydroxy-6-metoxy-1,4-benzoquinol methylase